MLAELRTNKTGWKQATSHCCVSLQNPDEPTVANGNRVVARAERPPAPTHLVLFSTASDVSVRVKALNRVGCFDWALCSALLMAVPRGLWLFHISRNEPTAFRDYPFL